MADFNQWKNSVVGVGLDVDGAFGAQCTDVALSWAMACFPGIAWPTIIPPVPSAKDMFESYNPTYWERVVNDHSNPSQVPPAGSIAIFGAAPKTGYTSTHANPDGHTGVVDHADATYIYLVQQDGSAKQGVTQLKARPWRYSELKGWLVPKLGATPQQPAPSGDSRVGKTLFLHPVAKWRVYRVGDKPNIINAIGYLVPRNYSNGPGGKAGLSYPIVGVSLHPNTVTIRTDTYGLVDIYVDGDGEII